MSQANVFFIIKSEDYDDVPYGFVFSEPDISPKEIKNVNNPDLWEPLTMELRDGKFPDFLVNDLDIPLFSERLKGIVDSFVSDANYINWFPFAIKSKTEIRIYYFCKINIYSDDCMDFDKSIKDGEMIIVPYFITSGIKSIFRVKIDSGYLFVSEDLKNVIIDNQITGLEFANWDKIDSNTLIEMKDDSPIINQPYKIHEGKAYTKKEWETFREEQKKNRTPGTTWSLLDEE
ncbi:hypothetical protein [Testudinibacter aquarius]|uniref:Uncharacterized protein n=1 Tax=Testudinibacter aquarius TaxID=1524974 RepID=A0A4R3Y969_9PAST|nr:hypothetical protein [Testudinibacter aquarius]KAE9527485.1 hypothetical protein A1D24_11585 [Testudinibacter aquarius]TCV88905.1 hypothetical protein EDC16_103264 [Testudinibacter aquarius]TNG88738.1 hypothetical protein FHQ21_10995 [Testudinibacter aquarius]